MDNNFKLLYWVIGAVMFVTAIALIMKYDNLLGIEYRNILNGVYTLAH
jgi:hypothetical protein